jgi:hypothetical protein
LRERHRQELVPTRESPEVRVALVTGNTLLKFSIGQMPDQLRKDGAARVHPSLFHPEYRQEAADPTIFNSNRSRFDHVLSRLSSTG